MRHYFFLPHLLFRIMMRDRKRGGKQQPSQTLRNIAAVGTDTDNRPAAYGSRPVGRVVGLTSWRAVPKGKREGLL
jgi:hypothetical protein